MSTYWYAIEEDISLAKLEEVNNVLAEKKEPVIELFHDILEDSFWLSRTVDGKNSNLKVHDYSSKEGKFSRLTRYGQNGKNPTGELVLRPLVEIGKLTIVSEFDERSPYAQAQMQAMKDVEPDEKFVQKRLGEQTEEMASLMDEPKQHGLTMSQLENMRDECTDAKEKDYWRGRVDAFKGSVRYQNWFSQKTGGLKVSA